MPNPLSAPTCQRSLSDPRLGKAVSNALKHGHAADYAMEAAARGLE